MAQEPPEALHSEESTIVSTTNTTSDRPTTTSNTKKRKKKKTTTVEPPSHKRSKATLNDVSDHPKTPTTNPSSPYSNASSSSSHVVDEFELASAVALASLANAACASQPLATTTANKKDNDFSVTQTSESFGGPTRGPTSTHHDPTTLSPSRPQSMRPAVRTASSKEEELSIASASQEGGEDGLPAPVTPEKRTGYGETTSHQDASHPDSSTLEDSKSTTSATSTTAATTVATATSTTTTPHRRVHFAPNVKKEVTGVPLPHHRSHHPLHPYHHPRHVTHHPPHQLHHHAPHHPHHSHAQMVQRLQLPSSTPNASPPILYRTNSSASSPSRILPPPPSHAHLSPHSYPRAPSSSSFHTRVHSWPPPPRSSYPGATFLPPPPARPAVPPLPLGEASGAITTATTTTTSASTVTGDNNNTNTANPTTTPNAWVCDYCHAASFATYQEACLHEETCSVRLATLAASGGITSTTPATMTQLRPPLLRTASSSSSSSSSLSSQHHPWPPSSPVGTTRTAGGGPLLVYAKGHSSPTRGSIGRLAPPPPPPRAFLPLLSHSAPAEAGPAHDPSSLAFGGSPPVRMTTNSNQYHQHQHPKSSSTMVRSTAATAPGSNQWYTGSIALGIPQKDSEWLSPLQCLIRKECVQAFSAQESHVQAIRPKSRIALHQVGIACRFCQTHDKKQQQEQEAPKAAATKDPQDTSSTKPETEKEEEETQESWNAPQGTTKALETTRKDSSSFVAFPSSLSGILESVQRWHEEHAPHCPHIPSAVSSQLQRLAQDTQTRSTGTTTTTGRILKESTQTSQDHEETPTDTDQTREPTLETQEPSESDTSTPSKDSKTKSESNGGDPGPTAPTYSLSVRQYWMDSAKALGMVDTLDGIRFVQDPRTCKPNLIELDASMKYLKPRGGSSLANADNQTAGVFGTSGREPLNPHAQDSAQPFAQATATMSSQAGVPQHQPPSETTTGGGGSGDYIVHSKDAGIVPPYVYFLMRQVESCNFTEADRFVARSKGPVGYPGFQCRHCHGHAGLGKYFPVSSKSLSTNSTSQNIHAHLLKCRSCPLATKSHLVALKEEKAKAPRLEPGWRKVFFDKIWIRLHGTAPDPR